MMGKGEVGWCGGLRQGLYCLHIKNFNGVIKMKLIQNICDSPSQVHCTPRWGGGKPGSKVALMPAAADAQACSSKRQLRHPAPASARGQPQPPLCHHESLFAPPTHGYLGPTQHHHPYSSSTRPQSLTSFAESYFR